MLSPTPEMAAEFEVAKHQDLTREGVELTQVEGILRRWHRSGQESTEGHSRFFGLCRIAVKCCLERRSPAGGAGCCFLCRFRHPVYCLRCRPPHTCGSGGLAVSGVQFDWSTVTVSLCEVVRVPLAGECVLVVAVDGGRCDPCNQVGHLDEL